MILRMKIRRSICRRGGEEKLFFLDKRGFRCYIAIIKKSKGREEKSTEGKPLKENVTICIADVNIVLEFVGVCIHVQIKRIAARQEIVFITFKEVSNVCLWRSKLHNFQFESFISS